MGSPDGAGGGPVPAPPAFPAVLAAVRAHASFAFRRQPPADREEAVAAAVAHAWAACVRLAARGKDPSGYPSAVARFAVLAVWGGRRVEGGSATADALGPAAARRGVVVRRLDAPGARREPWWHEAVADPRAPVPRQAAFRIDFAAWLAALPRAKRRAAGLLARGWPTGAAARRLGVSAGRVSQLRRELEADWRAFHGEPARPLPPPRAGAGGPRPPGASRRRALRVQSG